MADRVVLITLGGTIARRSTEGGASTVVLHGRDLLDAVPGARGIADVEVCESGHTVSFGMSLEDWLALVQTLRRLLARGDVDGVVVTQGTATIEESAYLMDLFVTTRKSVVVTGAMQSSDALGWDGPRNVRDALLVATHPRSQGMGVLVVFNGTIHAARDVRKTHKSALDSFRSQSPGPLGEIDAGGVWWLREPRGRVTFEVPGLAGPVDLIKVVLGMSDWQVREAAAHGARGLVIEGFPGGGGVPVAIGEAIAEAARDIPVVLCPRSLGGRSVGGVGARVGPTSLLDLGVISGGDLASPKARLLLMAALATTSDRTRLSHLFDLATGRAPVPGL